MLSSLDYTYLYIYTLQRNCRGEFSLDFRSGYPEQCKGKVFYGHGASQWRINYHRMWVLLSTTCSNLQKQPNGKLLVAVNHNQLPTMASGTVDPIDWSHPPPDTGQYPLSSTCCTLQCGHGLQITRLAALSQPRTCDLRNARPMHCLCGHSGYSTCACGRSVLAPVHALGSVYFLQVYLFTSVFFGPV